MTTSNARHRRVMAVASVALVAAAGTYVPAASAASNGKATSISASAQVPGKSKVSCASKPKPKAQAKCEARKAAKLAAKAAKKAAKKRVSA